MAKRSVPPLSRILLAGLACLVVPATMHAQIVHPSDPLPSFEVATVKLRDTKVVLTIASPGSGNVVRIVGPARWLIAVAYNVTAASAQRVTGGPDWIDDQGKMYVVEGKIAEDLYAHMQTMSNEERRHQALLMMQSLLADRFKLRAHFEMREMPIYELTIAKDGPRLPPPNDTKPPGATPGSTEAPRPPPAGGEVVTKEGVRIRNLTLDGMLQPGWFGLGGRPILNHTGLTGTYNLTLNWVPDIPRPPGSEGAAPVPEGQASIFTVLQEQLGLKLTPSKAPVEVVVIDSIEKPSEN